MRALGWISLGVIGALAARAVAKASAPSPQGSTAESPERALYVESVSGEAPVPPLAPMLDTAAPEAPASVTDKTLVALKAG